MSDHLRPVDLERVEATRRRDERAASCSPTAGRIAFVMKRMFRGSADDQDVVLRRRLARRQRWTRPSVFLTSG